jgi:RHS repeat-associated protein
MGLFYYHNDHRGAPVFVTDKDANVVWLARYLPYGEVLLDEDVDGDERSFVNNLRYPGQYDDRLGELGLGDDLYYNMMRYYDPGMGRYMQAESAEWNLYLSRNPYGYANASPVIWIDPFGLLATIYEDPSLIPYLEKARDLSFYADWVVRSFETSSTDRLYVRSGRPSFSGGDTLWFDPSRSNPCAQIIHELGSAYYQKYFGDGSWQPYASDPSGLSSIKERILGNRAHNFGEMLVSRIPNPPDSRYVNPPGKGSLDIYFPGHDVPEWIWELVVAAMP